jgi:hypothetical protein
VALAEYPNLWRANLYSGKGDGSAPLLGLSPGQYTSLFGNLLAVGDGLYHGSGGQWQPPARWSSSICCSNERHVARVVVLHNNKHKRKEMKWRRNSSPSGVSSTMVGVAATLQQST